MKLILTIVFLFFVLFIGVLPFFILYLFSGLVYFILLHVTHYRKEIVKQNLSSAFPELSQNELEKLIRLFYKNLSDILIEGIKSFTMSRAQINKRHHILNPEILVPFFEQGKSIIAVTGHYANWEWGSLSAGLQTNYDIVAFYKPLSNKWIDQFLRWSRSRFGTTLASISETTTTFEKFKLKKTIFIMAADQSPAKAEKAIWVDFLGKDTAFLHGPEKHAINNNYPVFYVDIQRIKRGYYTLELSCLVENPADVPESEITRKFGKRLEATIKAHPENWLWSHRRWKLSR
jgi:KDO2-lipid IV(A) lauroyltransferase